jgi:hypothetical protein
MQLLTTDLIPNVDDDQKQRFQKSLATLKIMYSAMVTIQNNKQLRSHEDYTYRYEVPGKQAFECKLTCAQCIAETSQGARCKRTVCVGVPVCAQHAVKYLQVAIGRTKLADERRRRLDFAGLIACSSAASARQTVIFREGDYIIPYLGEVVTKSQVDARYDFARGHGRVKAVAPYVMEQNTGKGTSRLYDAACYRSYGAFVNTVHSTEGYARHLGNGQVAEYNCRFEYHHAIEPGQKGHNDADRFPALTATRDIKNGEEILVLGQPRNTRKKAKQGEDVYPVIDTKIVRHSLSHYKVSDCACDLA